LTLVQEKEQQQSPALINFIESLSQSKATRGSYLRRLRKFIDFVNVDDPENLLLWDTKVIENKIIDFVVACRNTGAAPRSISVYFIAIKHFYEMNDVVLNWKKIKRFVGRRSSNTKKVNDRPYTHAEIAKLLEYSTPRERVMILLMCSAGLRVGALPYLNVGHLRKIEEHRIYGIRVYVPKDDKDNVDDEYITFCTPECAAAIDSYVNFRKERLGEIITDETPLLVNLSNKERGRNGTNIGGRITLGNIEITMYRLLKDIGMRHDNNKKTRQGDRHVTAICHSLRKFFRSQLKFAGVDHLEAETLLGHSTGLVGVYTKIPDEQLLQSYTKAIGHLTINNEERERVRADRLEAETSEQKQIIAKTFEMYQEMQKQINELRSQNGVK
jgi:site-specific recombinase XerD